MKLVVVMALRSHVLGAAVFGPYATDERTYATSLWQTVPDHSLVLVDRNHLQANVLVPHMTIGTSRHWMTRAKSSTKFTSIRRLGPGDEVELGFGEIKTDMLERLETIRSKSPSAVAQEMWGLLIAYNLVRLEMGA